MTFPHPLVACCYARSATSLFAFLFENFGNLGHDGTGRTGSNTPTAGKPMTLATSFQFACLLLFDIYSYILFATPLKAN